MQKLYQGAFRKVMVNYGLRYTEKNTRANWRHMKTTIHQRNHSMPSWILGYDVIRFAEDEREEQGTTEF